MECEEEELMESSTPPLSPSSQATPHLNIHTQHTPPPHHTSYGLSLPLSADVLQGQAQAAEVVGVYHSPCSPQISLSEYNAQAGDFTQQALREMKASPEYKRHLQKCHSCGASWFDGVWSKGCSECGDGAMKKACFICHGNCGRTWRRNVEMSHSMHSAHWDGGCGHKEAAAMLKDMLQLAGVMDAMEELKT